MSRLPKPSIAEDHRVLAALLSDLKDELRIEHNDQDRLLLRKILGATEEAEQFIGTAIIERAFNLVLASFPDPDDEGIVLPNPPIRSVTSVSYYDSAGNAQTFDAANYSLITAFAFPTICLVSGGTWPGTQSRKDAVTVAYTAGHAAKPSAVPAAIHEAILLRSATRYANAEEFGVGTVSWSLAEDLSFKRLLAPYVNGVV